MNRTERATDRGGSPSLPGWSYETIRNVTALLPDVRRLVLGSTVSALGNGLVLPLTLIYLHRVRHIVLPTTGLLLAVPGVVGLVAVPLAGIAMDRFGARRVLAVALLLTAGAQFAFGFADSPAWFVPVLFVQGLGQGPSFAALNTALAGLTTGQGQQRAFALLGLTGFAALDSGLPAYANVVASLSASWRCPCRSTR